MYVIKEHEHEIEYDENMEGALEKAEEDLNKIIDEIHSKALITDYKKRSGRVALFGGRIEIYGVTLSYRIEFTFEVDGVRIKTWDNESYLSNYISLNLLMNFLNSIAVYGIDEFLDNYKKSVKDQIAEFEERLKVQTEELTQLEETGYVRDNLLKAINKLNNLIMSLLSVLFLLNIHYPLGLENDKMIEVMEQVDKMFGYV